MLTNGSGFGKNFIIFGADMSWSVHIDNKKKDIFIVTLGPTQEFHDIPLTVEKEYALNFTEQQKKFCCNFTL